MKNKENKKIAPHEGGIVGYNIVLDRDACTVCSKCIRNCPYGVFKLENKKIVITDNVVRCDGCSKCISVCIYDAIEIG